MSELCRKLTYKIDNMRKTLLLIAASLFNIGAAYSQLVDVTSTYVNNASFEDCEAVAVTDCYGYSTTTPLGTGHSLIANYATAGGYDYESTSWKLVEQNTNANGDVVSYGNKVQYSKSGFEDVPAAGPNITSGSKALCFCGNNNLVYKQTNSVTLPAGSYKMTVNIYAYNGAYSSVQPTTKIKTFTGFVDNDGTEYFSEERSDNNEIVLNSNAWNQEVVYFELAKATTGHIQVSYGAQYFVVVDDIRLEGESGVVTSQLSKVVTKAKALNAELSDATLTSAISSAEAFLENPTSQDDVTTQVETLYAAMATALSASSGVVDITSAYLENPSFEAERKNPWTWGDKSGIIGEAGEMYQPFIDGEKFAEFTSGGSITQTISNLPAGFYALDAKVNGASYLILGNSTDSKTICTGGKDPVFLRYYPAIFQMKTPADIVVGVFGNGKFRVDDFHLFYGKDAASLEARLLVDVKAVAQSILDNQSFSAVTGSERSDVQTALEGNDAATVNRNVNTFVTSLDSYNDFAKKKTDAANYTQAVYPYASATIFEDIQKIVDADATSRSNATELTTQLEALFFQAYVSNAYCEGVEKTDYTSLIKDANVTEEASGWAVQNMALVQLAKTKAWKNPKTGESDIVVFGTSSSYNYNEAEKKALVLKQTISGLPAGKYVLSVTMMATTSLTAFVFFDSSGNQYGKMVGKGTASGGKYGAGWNDYTIPFTKSDDGAQLIQIQATPANNYSKELYLDNFRLYLLKDDGTGIESIHNSQSTNHDDAWYDLSGRKVSKPSKGLYIVNGKKVILK